MGSSNGWQHLRAWILGWPSVSPQLIDRERASIIDVKRKSNQSPYAYISARYCIVYNLRGRRCSWIIKSQRHARRPAIQYTFRQIAEQTFASLNKSAVWSPQNARYFCTAASAAWWDSEISCFCSAYLCSSVFLQSQLQTEGCSL